MLAQDGARRRARNPGKSPPKNFSPVGATEPQSRVRFSGIEHPALPGLKIENWGSAQIVRKFGGTHGSSTSILSSADSTL